MRPTFNTRLRDEYGSHEHRRLHHGGQAVLREIQPLLHKLACFEDVGARVEDHHHGRKAEHGLRADGFEERQAVERVLQRHSDEGVHLLGGKAWSFRLHLDERRRELGEDIQRRVFRGVDADKQQRQRGSHDEHAHVQRPGDNGVQHGSENVQLLASHELRAEQLGGTISDDLGACGWAAGEHGIRTRESRATWMRLRV